MKQTIIHACRTNRGCIAISYRFRQKDDNLIPLSDGHFLIVHPDYLVKTEQELLPTHMYEVDLLGRCYRTYYVGDGIFDVYGEISAENKNLLVLS